MRPHDDVSRRVRRAAIVAVVAFALGVTGLALILDRDGDGDVAAGPASSAAPSGGGGSSYSPGWNRLPDPPLSPRRDTTSVWTGQEIVVVGGWEFVCPPGADCATPDVEPFADGAAFDLATSSWRPITAAPFGFTAASAVAVGRDAYFLTPTALLRYRPFDDEWDELVLPPGAHGRTVVAAGSELVVASSTDETGPIPDWTLDLSTGTWRALPDDPLPPSYDRTLVWDGSDLLVFAKPLGGDRAGGPGEIAGARLHRATDTWEALPPSGTSGYQAWALDGLVVVNPHFGAGAGGGIFDVSAGTWSSLPSHPDPAAWNGDMAGIVGRDGAVFGDSGSWVLDVSTSTWIEVPAPDGAEVVLARVAAGRDAFVVVGTTDDPLARQAWLWSLAGTITAGPPDQPVLTAACGAVGFPSLPADPSSFLPFGEERAALDLTSAGGEAGFFDQYEWSVAARDDASLILFGTPLVEIASGQPYASASLRREGDGWVPEGWGQCRIEVGAEGWGTARFVLDPAAEPDPSASTLAVLATETACASGRPPGDREVRPVVLAEDEGTVSIVVLVEPVRGGADCPSNPAFELDVELPSALGDRVIVDASVQPGLVRPWPPTPASLQSGGMDA